MEGVGLRIGIVGATGLVGRELVSIVATRSWPVADLKLFASRSREVTLDGRHDRVLIVDRDELRRCDVVFLTATSLVARELAPELAGAGVLVIDNSSAFRSEADVPLVIPEVNGDRIRGNLIANPNCSTILLLLVLAPLHRAFGCRHVHVSTYQAVSGAGAKAVASLFSDTNGYLSGSRMSSNAAREATGEFERAFNVWSHESAVDPVTGSNSEETKMVVETGRILDCPPRLSVTCIRVPVERAHAESVSIQFDRSVAEADVRQVLATSTGLRIVDDRDRGLFPTSRMASGGDDVLVGRIRVDSCGDGQDGASDRYQLWLAGDQLRKGAALNAVQIVEHHERFKDLFTTRFHDKRRKRHAAL